MIKYEKVELGRGSAFFRIGLYLLISLRLLVKEKETREIAVIR